VIEEHGLQALVEPTSSSVRVADGRIMKITGKINLHLQFKDKVGHPNEAVLTLMVLEGLSLSLVIGISSIVTHFKDLFIEMLNQHEVMEENLLFLTKEEINAVENATSSVFNPEEETEEEEMIPYPESFPCCNFLGKSLEEAEKQYHEEIIKKVTPEFAEYEGVMEFLHCETAVRVFVPDNWDGINGVLPLRLEFSENMPKRIKPPSRPRPPRLFEATKKEFTRMLSYFYVESNSSIASPLVVAPKATDPFIRICGDYRVINQHLKASNYPIPDVIRELHKAKGFGFFIDVDLSNAFHQIKLHLETSEALSIQTQWGLFRPLLLPEGVSPASQELMHLMYDVFADFQEWTIVIFDNILILATDKKDGLEKMKLVIGRCHERNIHLKLSKCKFGIRQVEFFGYVIEDGKYALSEERATAVTSIQFPVHPQQTKKMQRFLGAAIYFRPFIPDYAEKTVKLYEMTGNNFSWNEADWKIDYRTFFEDFKISILNSFTLYHPNYEMEWILKTDASDYAVGGVLLQVGEVNGEKIQQVITFVSKKLSGAATRWSTIEKDLTHRGDFNLIIIFKLKG
jgi:hypothetical protein